MNKWIKVSLCFAIMGALLTSAPAYASSTSVFVNGSRQYNAIMVEGRTLVKLRALTDPAWLVFAYDPKTHTVMFHTKDNSKIVELLEGETTATVNGNQVDIDVAVVNKDGFTFIPLRFISETLGAYVNYNAKDNRVIVRTPTFQDKYKMLMQGDITEARQIALGLTKINGEAPSCVPGEGYNYTSYTFPEGEALRFKINHSGYCSQYYEVNEEGYAILKWQNDTVAEREWGKKPSMMNLVYFLNEFRAGVFTYGKLDSQGNDTLIGRFNRDDGNKLVLPIEGEKRIDGDN
ncbi:copper amine oxidase N-terminal domain-containing protein [Paenibacillus sp. BC26]|uniref:copper amine oxidase N-terminal domain-containing protein n=1 Tax=Paenibacillus sp. BC26 TaxID=1881032 RepID=UPI0008F29746|nr:copper amine oxidase N-terminal domain-containing protein [Paenibacillus sp. BC26]SFS76533.1 Copper amine oxidase N-terminal domain-containing protein [Paenibacillus sp. BC26]